MDRILPSQEHACENGLPGFPYPLEKLVKTLIDMPIDKLKADEIELLDMWVEARKKPVYQANRKHGNDRKAVARELGWDNA